MAHDSSRNRLLVQAPMALVGDSPNFSAAKCGRHPRSMPFPDPLHGTLPPDTRARSRFAAITASICRQITSICRQICVDLAANCPRSHGASAVHARRLRCSRTTSPQFTHCTSAVPARRFRRPCGRIFTCGEMEIATSPFIYRCVTISLPEKPGNLQCGRRRWK